MSDTKEGILLAALRLFACRGYEAVSVSDIAGALGMAKSALYKHYKSKRDIFEHIVDRMDRMDYERAKAYAVPEGTFAQMEEAYRHTQLEQIKRYSQAQFQYWTEEEFPSGFRKMLTLEQYGSAEMAALYQQYLGSGPVGYLEDLFGALCPAHPVPPRQLALAFYGPMYLLISLYDAAQEKSAIVLSAQQHIGQFIEGLKQGNLERWGYNPQKSGAQDA